MKNDDKAGIEPEQTDALCDRIDEDKKAQIYYDHYKDTYKQVKNLQKKRDRYLPVLLILLSVVLLLIYDPDKSFSAVQVVAEQKFGIKGLTIGLANMICVCLMAYISFAYYRVCLGIERLYIYIHNVEFNLSSMIELNIDREGKNYLSGYPNLLNLAHGIYTYGIPAFIIITIIGKVIKTIDILPSLYGFVELLLLIVTFLSAIVYVIDRIILSRSSQDNKYEVETERIRN